MLFNEPASVLPNPVIAPLIVPPNVVKAASGNKLSLKVEKKPSSSFFLSPNNSFVVSASS